MQRLTVFVGLLTACTIAAASCSGSAQPPLSPSGTVIGASALNPDGSSLKVTAPASLSPNGGTIDTLRPTLSFNNSTGRFATIGLAYEIEVYTESGNFVYSRVIGAGANSSSHQLDSDLEYATNYQWRSRGRLGSDTGPWSGFAAFRTLNRPGPPVPPPGALPFPIPAECGVGNPSNRFPCVAAMSALSAEWRVCASGVGIGCHRFSRQVVYALAQTDPNYRMIRAAPGGNACDCSRCGPSDGTMFREDTTVYGGNRVFDMIGGAGGPTPSIGWSEVPGPRPGDVPADAPLCVP